MLLNFKQFLFREDTKIAFVLVGVALGAFFLGRMSALNIQYSTPKTAEFYETKYETSQYLSTQETQEVTSRVGSAETQSALAGSTVTGGYVASKNGSKYHLPWCSGAQRIKEENKVWFETKAEAEKAGYTPAANCPGI